MARISTYSNDTSINDHDRLIGTDGGIVGDDGQIVAGTAGLTKNFLLSELRDYFDGQSGLQLTDGDIPRSIAGALVDSLISQDNTATPHTICVGRFSDDGTTVTEDANLKVAGDVRIGGHLRDLRGQDIVTPSGHTQLRYNTAAVNGGVMTLAPFTLTVITGAGIKMLPANPNDGDWVKIVDLTPFSERVMINAGTNRFMNDSRAGNNVLILDSTTTSFELVYVADISPGNTQPVGWVIVGAR